MYPNVSAVGYEVLPCVAELARQQAVSLGMVLMPDLPDPERIELTLPVRAQMLVSIAYPRWSIYWPQSANVRDELERAGFVHLHTIPHPRTTYIVMRLPE